MFTFWHFFLYQDLTGHTDVYSWSHTLSSLALDEFKLLSSSLGILEIPS